MVPANLAEAAVVLVSLLLTPHAYRANGPFEQRIRQIAEILTYPDGLEYDETNLDDIPARVATLVRTSWELKQVGQFAEPGLPWTKVDALKLPESERLAKYNRFDDHVQIWAVARSANVGAHLKPRIKPADTTHQLHRELFYLGQDTGFAWYAHLPIHEFAILAEKLSLKGDELIPALIRGVGITERTRYTTNTCQALLAHQGSRAISAVDQAIRDRVPQRKLLIMALAKSGDAAVTRWLIGITHSDNKDEAEASRSGLLWYPREAAKDLYIQWLAEGAGRREVGVELRACAAVRATAAAPLLAKVLDAPANEKDYRKALELSREWAGKPGFPTSMLQAETRILESGHGQPAMADRQKIIDAAVETILSDNDTEAAAAISLSLGLCAFKGSSEPIRRAGIEILRRLPDGRGRKLAERLARTNQLMYQQNDLKAVFQALAETRPSD